MAHSPINSKLVNRLYAVILPILVIALFLGIASINSRPKLLGSSVFDFIIRSLLTGWFCVLYIKLSRFSSFSFYPNKRWSKVDVSELEKFYLIGMIFIFSIACGILTYWVIEWFLPNISILALGIAIVNSILIFLPMGTQYWVLKL